MIGFPRVPVVEMYLGDWVDITSDVRQSPGISITRGRKDEAAKPSPSQCRFTLDDASGDYSPRNPNGQWYGTIGRNTPVRVALKAGEDTFTRTVVSGWGTSPTMGAWTDFSSATSSSSVSSNEGRHSVTSTAAYHASYLDDVNVKNIDVRVDVTIDAVSGVTGGDLEPANILLRGQNTSTYYMLRVTVTQFEAVELRIMAGDSQTLAGPWTIPNLIYGSGTLRVRFQADANTFRGKVWKTTSPEPVAWDLTYSHGDVYGAGWIGIRSGVGAGNANTKPVVFRYDNLTVTIPRFAGETAQMTPLSDLNHSNQRVQVECAGILRRLSQGAGSLQSAPWRYYDGPASTGDLTLGDYWPLEDKPLANAIGSSANGGHPAIFSRETGVTPPTGAIEWGAASGFLTIPGAPQITNGARLALPVRNSTLGSSWSVSWLQKISADTGAGIRLKCANPDNDIVMIVYTDGSYEVFLVTSDPFNSVLIFFGTFPEFGFDDVWHRIVFSAYNISASQVGFAFSAAPGSHTNTAVSPVTFSPLRLVEFQVDTGTNKPCAFSHVAVFPERLDSGSPTLRSQIDQAVYGHGGATSINPSEAAGTRFDRLLAEEGISHAMVGYPTITPLMGPQRPLPLVTLVQECVDADQGTMYEPRGDAALAMRTLRSMISKPAVVTLDYASGEIAPDFGPIEDDQSTVNDVTAQRPSGGEYRVEQATGPLNTGAPGTSSEAVGRYDSSVTVNVATDRYLSDAAGWRVHLGTIDEPRFPTITVDMRANAIDSQPDLVTQLLDLDIDDALTITNVDAARIYDDVRQIVRGYKETFDTAYRHTLVLNCTPASAYDGATLDSSAARLDSEPSALNGSATSTATALSVASDRAPWSTTAAPFDIKIGGERMTVTAVSGASSPQTFTVTRSVNGVVAAHPNGASVNLFSPIYLVP